MKQVTDLHDVIRELYGVESTHRASVPVKEVFRGETVWDGVVEVFDLHGHRHTDTAYAWSHRTHDPTTPAWYFTVLHILPVHSPLTAVRAFLLQRSRNARGTVSNPQLVRRPRIDAKSELIQYALKRSA